MIISSQSFEAHLICPTKYFLITSGEVGTGNAYAEWAKAQNELYQRNGVLHLTQGIPSNEYAISPPTTMNLKAAKWRLTFDVEFTSECFGGSNSNIMQLSRLKVKKENKADVSPSPNKPIHFWNYQREKILLKSNHYLKRIAKARKERALGKPKANKIIQSPPPSSCPNCSRIRVQKVDRRTKTILDMQFGRSGIKRWVTQHQFYRYYCPTCGSRFQNAGRVWSKEKCGPNIEAFSIYLTIYLGLTLEKIATFLNEILGFNFDRHTIYRFKSYAAKYYKNTYEGLL